MQCRHNRPLAPRSIIHSVCFENEPLHVKPAEMFTPEKGEDIARLTASVAAALLRR